MNEITNTSYVTADGNTYTSNPVVTQIRSSQRSIPYYRKRAEEPCPRRQPSRCCFCFCFCGRNR